jgi:hypothetical protein
MQEARGERREMRGERQGAVEEAGGVSQDSVVRARGRG